MALGLMVLSACARPVKPDSARRIIPEAPFSDDPISFVIAVPHFPPGEVTIVRVCLAPDRSIASTNVMESSGDARFDGMALIWARQIRLRSLPNDSTPVRPCGEVRVEIRAPSEPRVMAGPDVSLG
jgi:hypothetical protein